MTGYFDAAPRAPHAGDFESMRALVRTALGVTPYVDRVIGLLDAAERGDPESRALVVARDGTVAALALYGPVAGTANTWKITAALVAPQLPLTELGGAMIEAVVARARSEGGRLLVSELADDVALGRSLALLLSNGFGEEGRVRDFFRAGTSLLFLRREL